VKLTLVVSQYKDKLDVIHSCSYLSCTSGSICPTACIIWESSQFASLSLPNFPFSASILPLAPFLTARGCDDSVSLRVIFLPLSFWSGPWCPQCQSDWLYVPSWVSDLCCYTGSVSVVLTVFVLSLVFQLPWLCKMGIDLYLQPHMACQNHSTWTALSVRASLMSPQ